MSDDDARNAASAYLEKTREVQLRYTQKTLELLDVQPGSRVLDIGCGTGNLVNLIADKVGPLGYVVGIDPCSERIKVAQEHWCHLKNVEFHICKSVEFPFDPNNLYDHFVTNSVLHWIPSDEKIATFQRVFEALKPGGTFVGNSTMRNATNIALLVDFVEKSYKFNFAKEKQNYASYDWLKNELQNAGFEIVRFEKALYNTNLGSMDNYVEWLNASLHDRYNIRKVIEQVADTVHWLKDADGGMIHDSEQAVFLVRKPC